MTGRRLRDVTLRSAFAPGDYGRWHGYWVARPPRGFVVLLTDHDITEHDDGAITVSPAILASPAPEGTWLLERGVWREV